MLQLRILFFCLGLLLVRIRRSKSARRRSLFQTVKPSWSHRPVRFSGGWFIRQWPRCDMGTKKWHIGSEKFTKQHSDESVALLSQLAWRSQGHRTCPAAGGRPVGRDRSGQQKRVVEGSVRDSCYQVSKEGLIFYTRCCWFVTIVAAIYTDA